MPSTPQDILDGIYLFSHTEHANNLTVAEFVTDFINPLTTGNAVLYYAEKPNGVKTPAGLTTWCWFTNEQADAFARGEFSPSLDDYAKRSGDQLWGVWMLAPFGHFKQVWKQMSDTCQSVYGPQKVHWIRLGKDTTNKIHEGKM